MIKPIDSGKPQYWRPKETLPTNGVEIYFNHACLGLKIAKYAGGWLFKCSVRGVFVESGFGLDLDLYHCIGWQEYKSR